PGAEVCDGVDNDCDGQTDNAVTDGWLSQACCPTGVASDCANSGGATRCQSGAYACSGGAKVCSGAVVKSAEVCDQVDNDCDGAVDDVAGLGAACTGSGISTKGICKASYACTASSGTGPNGLTCVQTTGPSLEL